MIWPFRRVHGELTNAKGLEHLGLSGRLATFEDETPMPEAARSSATIGIATETTKSWVRVLIQ